MENNHSRKDHSVALDQALSLPHFDEDATLLSARPVVPLHEVRADTPSMRRVIFGLTVLPAILGGAISATLLLMQGGQNSESKAESGVSQPQVSSWGSSGGTTSESAEAMVPVLTEPIEEPHMREEPGARDSSINKPKTAAISRRSIKPTKAGSPDHAGDKDFKSDESSLRRNERRNARREAGRQLRHRREQMGDDLLRIREIFEGSPRP
jgi:hypothetical protein